MIDEIIKAIEKRAEFYLDCTKYGNKNAKHQAKSYGSTLNYEVADLIDDIIEIVREYGTEVAENDN